MAHTIKYSTLEFRGLVEATAVSNIVPCQSKRPFGIVKNARFFCVMLEQFKTVSRNTIKRCLYYSSLYCTLHDDLITMIIIIIISIK